MPTTSQSWEILYGYLTRLDCGFVELVHGKNNVISKKSKEKKSC